MSVDLATLLRISTRLPVETSRIFYFIKDVVFMQGSDLDLRREVRKSCQVLFFVPTNRKINC